MVNGFECWNMVYLNVANLPMGINIVRWFNPINNNLIALTQIFGFVWLNTVNIAFFYGQTPIKATHSIANCIC